LNWKLCFLAIGSLLLYLVIPTGLSAADQFSPGLDDRLQRMEQRINELAERQEQFMRRFSGPQDSQGQMPRRFGSPQQQQGPMLQPGPQNPPVPMQQDGPRPMGQGRRHDGPGPLIGLFLLGCLVCNILLAVWIYGDIRKRGEGSGIFVALALVAGVPAAIIYSLVRIGDRASPAAK
jgi:hypothetical protein